jgi:hypothetical protein
LRQDAIQNKLEERLKRCGGDGSAALALCASKDAWILDTSGISAILEAGIHW